MTTTAFTHYGTVSHGTMLPEHLIPTFLAAWRELEPQDRADRGLTPESTRADIFATANARELALVGQDGEDAEYTAWLLDELFRELDSLAPDGYYFGAHPGDGSDYGFWQAEQD